MPVTRVNQQNLVPHDARNWDNDLNVGMLYDANGKALDQVFIEAKKPNGETITIPFTIEDGQEIIHAIEYCINAAILARHERFSCPIHVPTIQKGKVN